jgi:hypothetical protein
MLRRRHIQPPLAPPKNPRGGDFAWRVHEAQQAWTASVDIKASIVLVVEVAVAGAAGKSLLVSGGVLHDAHGLHLAVAITAVVLLSFAVGSALWVVFPRLERRGGGRNVEPGLIYFGHLRHRSVDDIEAALANLDEDGERHEIARQLRVTAQVAWKKHAWLQKSLAFLAVGVGVLVVALVAF